MKTESIKDARLASQLGARRIEFNLHFISFHYWLETRQMPLD